MKFFVLFYIAIMFGPSLYADEAIEFSYDLVIEDLNISTSWDLTTEIMDSKPESLLEPPTRSCKSESVRSIEAEETGTNWIFLKLTVSKCDQDVNYTVIITDLATLNDKTLLIPKNCTKLTNSYDAVDFVHINLTDGICNNQIVLKESTRYSIVASSSEAEAEKEIVHTAPELLFLVELNGCYKMRWTCSECSLPMETFNVKIEDTNSNSSITVNGTLVSPNIYEIDICEILRPCVEYNLTVTSMLPDGKSNKPFRTKVRTIDLTFTNNVKFPVIEENWFQAQWELPKCDFDLIKYYTVTLKHQNGIDDFSVDYLNNNKSKAVANINGTMITPCTNYTISMNAIYENGIQLPNKVTHTISTGPGKDDRSIRNFKTIPSQTSFNLTWESPQCKFIISSWNVSIYNRNYSKNLTLGREQRHFVCKERTCMNIKPCDVYSVTLVPVYSAGYPPGKATTINITTLPVLEKPKNITRLDFKEDSISLQWDYNNQESKCVSFDVVSSSGEVHLLDKRSAEVTKLESCHEYNIIIIAKSDIRANNVSVSLRTAASDPKSNITQVWHSHVNSSHVKIQWHVNNLACFSHFQVAIIDEHTNTKSILENATEDYYYLFSRSVNTEYRFIITLWNKNNESVEAKYLLYIEEMEAATVALIGVVCFLLIVIVLVAFIMLRTRQRKRNLKSQQNSNNGVIPLSAIRRNRLIKLENLPHITALLTALRNYEMEKEYQELKLLSCFFKSTVAAELAENKGKNRYVNVLPFDETRVKLIALDGSPCSDYINASYVEGYNGREEYIAAQGPLNNTLNDFWKMIWEQNISLVVMLTSLQERGQVKCASYWPDTNTCQEFGDIKLENLEETEKGDYVIREIRVENKHETRSILQYHFLKWPDFGCPESPNIFLNFVRDVRNKIQFLQIKEHILVHCSAGVGRTGTFIAVDWLTQQAHNSPEIDIFGTVLKLRSCRSLMVQNEDQYGFIYHCMSEFVQTMLELKQTEEAYDDDSVILLKNGDQEHGLKYEEDIEY